MVPKASCTLDGHPEVKQELHSLFPLLANKKSQASISFLAYNHITKISPVQDAESRISQQCLHPIFSAYPLSGAYLLITYTYKCMLYTRVYGIVAKQSLTKWQIDCSLLQKSYYGNMPTMEVSGGSKFNYMQNIKCLSIPEHWIWVRTLYRIQPEAARSKCVFKPIIAIYFYCQGSPHQWQQQQPLSQGPVC